jgi:dUTP pyrophosphatase
MKLKIYIKRFKNENGEPIVDFPKVIKKGDWVDLRAAEEVVINAPQAGTLKGHDVKHRDVVSDVTYIPLGVAMKLPDGFEAIIASRSSAAKKIGVMLANGIGIVDNSYQGDNDQWMYPAISLRKTSIALNTRLCQMRIQLSQKATMWQKIKWFFSSGIELVEVDSLGTENRMGLGSGTGYGNLE